MNQDMLYALALLAGAQMLAAIYLSHRGAGFFMNYFGQLPAGKEG